MANNNLKLDSFKSALRGGGARANLFSVQINFPAAAAFNQAELINFMCTATNLPASTITDIPVTYRGRVMHVAGDKTFEPWSITIMNDTKFEIRNAFETWMNEIAFQGSSKSSILFPNEYKAPMTVYQLDRDEKVIASYKFVGVYPSNVSSIELSNESGEIETFTVELQVDYWTRESGSGNGDTNPVLKVDA